MVYPSISQDNSRIGLCPFCLMSRKLVENAPSLNFSTTGYICNGCGKYYVSDAFNNGNPYIKPFKYKINCAAENVILQESGQYAVWAGEDDAAGANLNDKLVLRRLKIIGQKPIAHSNKMNELLLCLARKVSEENPFKEVLIAPKDRIRAYIGDEAELHQWLLQMKVEGWIECLKLGTMGVIEAVHSAGIRLTAKGWLYVESLSKGIDSREAFVAMAFSKDMGAAREAMRSACRASGWEASLVDEKHFNEGITDEILTLIKRSAFVISDFTHHKNGVYFEAGFGRGLGKPTIHTVRKPEIDGTHFDTKHLNHICWDNEEDLEKLLVDRIRATIPGSKLF
ncbi:MAG: hypothetical protein EOP04_00455 [Proteobacteria bacterium]|nr:MAG: hypothetical protein EOP04_00455 [Pseudomonadota bacterium]